MKMGWGTVGRSTAYNSLYGQRACHTTSVTVPALTFMFGGLFWYLNLGTKHGKYQVKDVQNAILSYTSNCIKAHALRFPHAIIKGAGNSFNLEL